MDISGIPNLGIPAMGGGGFFADPAAGLANAQAQYAQNAGYFGNQAAAMHASQVPQAQLYGGGFFGAQPAAYAGLAAAYGRGTGGFGGGGGTGIDTSTMLPDGGSVFDTGAAPVPYQDAPPPGSFSPSHNYMGGRDAIAQSMMPSPPDFDATFGQYGLTGPQMRNQPAIDAVQGFSGVGTDQYPYPMPSFEGGGSQFDQAFGAFPEGGSQFADRFAAGNYYRPGTPSQYYTGDQYPDAMAPPSGYETLFGPDNPRGALPVGGFRGLLQPGVMGAGGDGGEDTLTAQDANIPFGPAGSFDPGAFRAGMFAPGSPFGSGAGAGGRPGGSGGLGMGLGTMMPPTALPFSGAEGSGFAAPGSTQRGGLYAGSGMYPALIGAGQDQYGNPFIQGNAPPYGLETGRMGGGYGIGGLGQGTAFRPVGIR